MGSVRTIYLNRLEITIRITKVPSYFNLTAKNILLLSFDIY